MTPLILNSLPKSGTYLLKRVLEGLPGYSHCGFNITRETARGDDGAASRYLIGVGDPLGISEQAFEKILAGVRPATYTLSHLPFTPETQALLAKKDMRMLVILRDPRDVVCSLAYFALKDTAHRLHGYFKSLPDIQAGIRAAISGIRPASENDPSRLLPITERMRALGGWTRWENARPVLFEHLVGARGGGDDTLQARAVSSILDHLGYDLPETEKQALCARIFSRDSSTFRRGQIGGWRNHFTPELERYFHEQAGEALEHYLDIAGRLQ